MRSRWPLTGLVLGLLVLVPGGVVTEQAFARVHYPGAGFGGVPLSFDLRHKYDALDALERNGTLDQFVLVQALDVTIIVGTLLVFTSATLLAARHRDARLRRLTTAAFVLAPAMDASENVSLLALIASRDRHPDWLNLLHSCCTLGKAVFFVAGWCGLAVLLAARLQWSVRNGT
ncbi:MAG: hypothetical protein HOY78_00735 [Saccharothrix sp.]|nr:hypothetical protein [Saccharothrix sp.]